MALVDADGIANLEIVAEADGASVVNGVGAAGLDLDANGGGGLIFPSVASSAFGFFAASVGGLRRQKVRVITTAPQSGRGKTGLSHTGFN